MSNFELSLRSSPKPRKAGGSARPAPSLPLKQSFVGMAQETTKFNTFASSLRNPVGVDHDVSSVWEPPLSCQRTPVNLTTAHAFTKQEQLFFPLELTSGDYTQKIFRHLSAVFAYLCHSKFPNAGKDSVVNGHFDAFLNICGTFAKIVVSTAEKNKSYLCGELKAVPSVEEHLRVLVAAHDDHVALREPGLDTEQLSQSEAGRLTDLSPVFTAAKALINGLLKAPRASETVHSAQKVLHDLDLLEHQCKLHRVFKDQRMAALSWQWPTATAPGSLRTSSRSFDVSGALNMSNSGVESKSPTPMSAEQEQQQARLETAKQEAEEVRTQLQALLQPTTLANVQLFHRLVSIVQDLDVLMRALSVDNEYSEAQRLRELKAVVDNTITPQGRALLDQVKQCCTQAHLLVNELRHHCDLFKAHGAHYNTAHGVEALARELNFLQKELRTNGVAPFSLLSQSSVVERLGREGSAFVTSDFLFSEPHQQHSARVLSGAGSSGDLSPSSPQQSPYADASFNYGVNSGAGAGSAASAAIGPTSIGSLVIRAGSNIVLYAIRSTWPGLNSLSRTGPDTGALPPGSPSKYAHLTANTHDQQSGFPLPAPPHSPGQTPFGSALLSPINNTGRSPHSPFGSNNILDFPPRNRSANNLQDEDVVFNPADQYNDVGFSPTILSVLMSFEELQRQLHELLSPASVSLTQLIQRLVGVSADLVHLAERAHRAGQYDEGDRLLSLRAVVEATIDADLHDNTHELVCGRGRRRLDNTQVLMQQVLMGSRELQRLAIRSRAESDFTGAQALDEVAADLTKCLNKIESHLASGVFSLLDAEHGSVMEAGLEIHELIAREGTTFLTSDYIFQVTSGREGHSIGSLAIIAGAGAVLRFIRAEWPGLSALSAPLYGTPQLPSHAEEQQWGELSFEVENKNLSNVTPYQDANGVTNFRDASSLRLLGFDASSLRLAGFSDISIVTAGYTAAELRDANFSTEQLRQAGLTDSALRVVGFQTEQQADVLAALFRGTDGTKWKDHAGWKELLRVRRLNESNPPHLQPTTTSATAVYTAQSLPQQLSQQQAQRFLLQGLQGVKCDENTGEVLRIFLPSNNLRGQLPGGLGSVTSITQLVLSDNHLGGAIPASIGLLVHLENLHLDRNQFEGEIPKAIKSLERLVVLKLEHNRLSGAIPAVLGGLHRLRRLDLSHNLFTGNIPPRISQLVLLQELILNNNQLSGHIPEGLGQMTALTSLQLQCNLLQGYVPSSIARLVKLTGLNIQQNPDLTVDRLQLQRALPRCRIKM